MNLKKIRNSPLFKFFYKLSFLLKSYHFLLAFVGVLIYFFPSRKIKSIGITGTKGKTTVLEILNAILEEAGKRTALLSSLCFKINGEREKNLTNNTMPGRFFIQKFLKKAVAAECEYVLIEVTSEGARYSRHRFINWAAGAVTNLAPEHIESHGSFEKYREAKLKFLEYVAAKKGKIFLNEDDMSADFFSQNLKGAETVFYSKGDAVLNQLKNTKNSIPEGIDKKSNLLFREFNQENMAAAAAIARSFGVEDRIIFEVLKNFEGVPGRMDVVQENPFRVVVDYAHTPESLKKLYETLKDKKGILICVLGSAGGGRDKWKRPEMGRIAGEFCGQIILTDEDPYDEDPSLILNEIKSGIAKTQFPIAKVTEILDRKEAIAAAIKSACAGDTVVISGKGSEPFMHVSNGARIEWSDKETAKSWL